jgi:hypothetical protein
MSVLRKISAFGKPWHEEALPVVRRIGIQDCDRGRRAARAKENSEDHRLWRLREAGVVAFQSETIPQNVFAGYSGGWYERGFD